MTGVPLNLDIQQILLHLMNFVILFAILYFLLYKPVRNFMNKRQEAYQKMDDEARGAKEAAEEMKSRYEQQLAGADAEIAERKQQTIKAAEQRAKSIEAQAQEEAADILSGAKRQAESERDRIIGEAGDTISNMAKEAAEKAIFGTTSDAYDSFLNMVEDEAK